ncbi:hypothetical protein O7626_29845 [Micromonospora sp. WMMD1102]|uniref:hypothetical protein n=1 Tax=Micromonospora sp. WMMD1102 TaxID=3016105 RepID=UPI0024155B25|nr:hypothetical protein [Micromonospora sp. WMMD1102]MDG4790075.1 hypothetical protein [Micromonospora sp. WMMD1102]
MLARRLWTVLASLLVLGGCACACGPIGPAPDLSQEDLAGTWVNARGATLEPDADGTFTATVLHVCAERDEPPEQRAEPDGGRGTWELEAPETLVPYQTMNLSFGPPERFAWSDWQAADDEVFFYIGDPDTNDRCKFRRQ